MSDCDTCPQPGHCCRTMLLCGGEFPPPDLRTLLEADLAIRNDRIAGPPLPFHPLFQRQDGAWVLWCPNLNAKTGRCDDYENRPLACSLYEPRSDRLCILHEH